MSNNNRQPPNELVQFYYSIPLVTRTCLTLTIIISIGCHLKFIPYQVVAFDWLSIIKKFQFWRLVTPFFVQPVDFSSIFNIVFFFQQSKQLETNVFLNKSADYIYYLILTGISSLALSHAMSRAYLGDALFFSVMYLWSRHFSSNLVSFFFGITFKGLYLPWISVSLMALFSASIPYTALIGIASAFTYYTFCDIYISAGPRVLKAPKLLTSIFPYPENNFQSGAGYVATPPASRPGPSAGDQQAGDRWGKGYRLG